MQIKTFVFNPFYENTLVVSSAEKNAIIFDPGCYEEHELMQVKDYIELEGLSVKAIMNTHCHIDHVLGNKALKEHYGVPLSIPKNEKDVLQAVEAYAPQWGISHYESAKVDAYISEGEEVELDELTFGIIEVPGHSPGSIMFYCEAEKMMIGGDVLFRESIGRTDLPGGNHEALLKNIQEKVYVLPEDVEVYPGHGPTTTIAHEKNNNPFIRG